MPPPREILKISRKKIDFGGNFHLYRQLLLIAVKYHLITCAKITIISSLKCYNAVQ